MGWGIWGRDGAVGWDGGIWGRDGGRILGCGVGMWVRPPPFLFSLNVPEPFFVLLPPHSRANHHQRGAGGHVGERQVGHLHRRRTRGELEPGWGAWNPTFTDRFGL